MEGICEGFVVSDNVEVTAFHKVVKVFEGQVNGQQLTVEGAVLLLGRSKLPGEVYTQGGTTCYQSVAGGLHPQLRWRHQ